MLISLPVSGWLVTRKRSKRIVGLSVVLYTAILVTLGLSPNTNTLVIALFCYGFLGNMGNISINTQAVAVEALYKRNIMASFHGIWSLAGFTGAGFGTFMSNLNIIPPYHFTLVFIITLLIFLVSFQYLVRSDLQVKVKTPLFVLPDKSLLTLGPIAFCSMLCEGTMFDWSGVYFKKVVLAEPHLVGTGYTAFMCTMALSRFVADYFTVRFGFKRIIQVSGLIIMTGLLLAVVFPGFYTAIAGFLLVGIGVSSIVPLVYSAAGKSTTVSPGIALASVSTIGFFGFLIGPPLIGILAGISSLRLSFGVIATMGLAVTLLATITKEKH